MKNRLVRRIVSLSVIDKYVVKKEKDLLEYAKILESIISIDDNKMWQNKKEFALYAKEIIEIYADTYYFQNNKHKDNPIEYSNDNINFVLKSIIEYCRLHDKMGLIRTWKNETFLLSVIICTACYVDFASNVVDGDYQDTKNKFKYLLSYLRKTKLLNVKDNKYFINDLFEAVKKNASEDKKILVGLESDNYRNEYKMISNNPTYYEVKFSYEIPGLEEFDESLEGDYKNKVVININCKENISDLEKQDMIDIIRRNFGIQVKDLLYTYEKEQDKKAILLVVGIALIILYYTGFASILKDVILMFGWLAICSSVYGLIFSSTEIYVKIKRLKNLSKARIYFD